MLNKANEWGYVCEAVEFEKLALPEASIGTAARFLSADEARRIIEAAPEPLSTMFATLAMTGIRCGELLGLQVDDLDFERRLIFIRRSAWYGRFERSRARQARALPMPAPLAEMLVEFFENMEAERAAVAFCKSNRKAHERQQSRAEKAMADFARAQDSSLWTPCVLSHAFEPARGRRRSGFRCSSAAATRRSAYHARDLFSRGPPAAMVSSR